MLSEREGGIAAGKLDVVGTPIGNRGDLSPRARETFAAADAVLCEDTRVTGKLLAYAGVRKPLVRCDENVIAQRAQGLVERMRAGEVFAFASDAGMAGTSLGDFPDSLPHPRGKSTLLSAGEDDFVENGARHRF